MTTSKLQDPNFETVDYEDSNQLPKERTCCRRIGRTGLHQSDYSYSSSFGGARGNTVRVSDGSWTRGPQVSHVMTRLKLIESAFARVSPLSHSTHVPLLNRSLTFGP